MIYKNGIIQKENFYESDAMLMNKKTNQSYIPKKDTKNSCIDGEYILGFEYGKQYYFEIIISWDGFLENKSNDFGIWTQGIQHDENGWNWNYGNPMTSKINTIADSEKKTLTKLVTSSESGSKFFNGYFYANYNSNVDGYALGCRADYSNGIGKISYSNIKIIPAEYAVSTTPPEIQCMSEKHLCPQEILWNIKSSRGGDLIWV